ncbi:MAG: hydrogenase iron-sulfur subunit [Candidatus Bathycorpusculaceae bacterium]
MESDEYNIVCLMCNWAFCQDEMRIPSNVNVVRVMCIGRIDPAIVLEMFEKGVDGVMLVGCKPPDCHYVEGNLEAERAVKMLKKLLRLAGLEEERLKLLWDSPIDEGSFDYYVKGFSREIKKLGLSPLKHEALKSKILINVLAAKNAASDFRLRVLLGREKELTEGVNVYGEKLSKEEFDTLLDEIAAEEFVRHKIHVLTKTEPLSVKALADALEMKTAAVLRHIVNMRRKNMIALDHVEGTTPLYKALEVK